MKEFTGTIKESVKAQGLKSMYNPKYEASMQKLAREQLGDIVPEVLGTSKRGFIQEFAGVPIPRGHKTTPVALSRMNELWEYVSNTPGTRVRHFDPQIDNIVRKGTKVRMIDFGMSAQTEMLSPASRAFESRTLTSYSKAMNPQTRQAPPQVMKPTGTVDVTMDFVAEPKTMTVTKAEITRKRILKFQKAHRDGMIRSSINARRPGRRHTGSAGSIVK
jgi:hypothetical protein